MENNTQLSDSRLKAIAEYFEVEPEEIEDLGYDHYDLPVFEIDGAEYTLALDYDEAEEAATEAIKASFDEMPTAFSSWVLCDNMPNDISLESVDDLIINELDEVIKELVDIDGLVSDCIGYDGVGHYLATYDFEEIEIDFDDELMYLYRVN